MAGERKGGGTMGPAMEAALREIDLLNERLEAERAFRKSNPREYYRKHYNFDTKTGKPIEKKAKGGAAGFPDLTGDGKVTKKDVLRGRGVQGFEKGGAVRGMGAAIRGGNYKGCK